MYIPGFSTRRLNRRKGGGGKNGGGGGEKLNSGKSGSSGENELRISDVDGLPVDHDKTTTYGEGGRTPTESGSFEGPYAGDGADGQDHWSGNYSDFDYYDLLQNITQPGVEVVEVTMTTNSNDSIRFFLAFNDYNATEAQDVIQGNYNDATVSDPIPLNLGNLRLDNITRIYRGDRTAIIQGCESTRGILFPPSVNTSTWGCLDYTIEVPISLMNTSPSNALLGVFFFLSSLRILLN